MKVTIGRGATVNLGNYESARVDVTVEFEADTSLTFDEATREANKAICEWLEEEVANIQAEANTKPLPVTRFTGRS